nr:hypothetical protein [Mesorhizobium sp.]
MTIRKTLLASLAVLALATAPALAGAGGNGGGNGGGHGNSGDHGGGNGNGGGNGGGKGNSGATHGKASAPGQLAKSQDDTIDDATDDTPATPKEKNLHAKLGRLNSLQRNINAYMNSKSPKFAAIQAYVTQAAAAKNAQAAVEAATQAVADAQAALDDLNAQMTALQADPNATQEQIDALQGQIDDATTALNDANQALTDAQTEAANTPAPDDATLDAALADMANKPVDADVTDWAKGVLADKIDQAAAATTTP